MPQILTKLMYMATHCKSAKSFWTWRLAEEMSFSAEEMSFSHGDSRLQIFRSQRPSRFPVVKSLYRVLFFFENVCLETRLVDGLANSLPRLFHVACVMYHVSCI